MSILEIELQTLVDGPFAKVIFLEIFQLYGIYMYHANKHCWSLYIMDEH